jgi:hypothetical protein
MGEHANRRTRRGSGASPSAGGPEGGLTATRRREIERGQITDFASQTYRRFGGMGRFWVENSLFSRKIDRFSCEIDRFLVGFKSLCPTNRNLASSIA